MGSSEKHIEAQRTLVGGPEAIRYAEIQRLRTLAEGPKHIRQNALRLAARYLQGVDEDQIVKAEMGQLRGILGDDAFQDNELCEAHEAIFRAIAKEVVKIGEELAAQAMRREV